ncbi:TPA: hypothetical protein QDA93_002731 [Burkholderia vietnamiensis]|nr:hypothetical protein [Burkholderia vietnamiensis]HDR8994542.1 hypothetical protein [Burkholderia vietnamiensis]
MKNLYKKLAVVAGGVGASAAVFAQTSSGMDVSSTVTAISGVVTAIVAIGGAVLSIVVVAWGYKVVKGFIGR